ncbi:MAG: hypothetical protein AMJ93_06265 [Anaerolineae bacterium SM23_84]|nr:MAG: hypothetical protein AMJ93_06265 [Anaerolineae bacterium SM23_84]
MAADRQHTQEQVALPEAFVKQVKSALENLYDFAYLERHPLAQVSRPRAAELATTGGQHLRRELMAAIESLDPGMRVSFREPPARLYNLLHLHYVEGSTIQKAAHELGISLRQAYRDLRRGEENVASIFWVQRSRSLPQASNAVQASSIDAEISRLEGHPRPTDVRSLLHHAQQAVEQLAEQRAVRLCVDFPSEPVTVSTDPVIAQQVFVSTLSHTVQQAMPGRLYLALRAGKNRVFLALRYAPEPGAINESVIDNVVAQLADRLRWTVNQEDQPGNVRVVTMHMTARGPVVLVLDDNEGLVDLLQRYLTGHACQVTLAASGKEGLQLAQELVPDAIVLDVMMPEMDGWEFLQRLRARPQTAATPVIVCSVINDPELAYSLGASLFLPKPIGRDDVLVALHQLGVV